MDDKNYHVDYDALRQQAIEDITNQAMNRMLEVRLSDTPGFDYFFRLIKTANKHGVSTQTMIDILQDFKPEGSGNE